jgi:DNA invertase Pin-like site-specific DNA recombinase
MPRILTKEQVEKIPTLLNGYTKKEKLTVQEVADLYKVHNKTIHRWISILRAKGHTIVQKKGYKALL